MCLNRSTNEDGRCPGLVTKQTFLSGLYKMRFETAPYWENLGETCFFPYVEVGEKCKFQIHTCWIYHHPQLQQFYKIHQPAFVVFTYFSGLTKWIIYRLSDYDVNNLPILYAVADLSRVSHLSQIVFIIKDPGQKYHVPLLLTRFSYSTYRGS